MFLSNKNTEEEEVVVVRGGGGGGWFAALAGVRGGKNWSAKTYPKLLPQMALPGNVCGVGGGGSFTTLPLVLLNLAI